MFFFVSPLCSIMWYYMFCLQGNYFSSFIRLFHKNLVTKIGWKLKMYTYFKCTGGAIEIFLAYFSAAVSYRFLDLLSVFILSKTHSSFQNRYNELSQFRVDWESIHIHICCILTLKLFLYSVTKYVPFILEFSINT
jgi:hypothetical protein